MPISSDCVDEGIPKLRKGSRSRDRSEILPTGRGCIGLGKPNRPTQPAIFPPFTSRLTRAWIASISRRLTMKPGRPASRVGPVERLTPTHRPAGGEKRNCKLSVAAAAVRR